MGVSREKKDYTFVTATGQEVTRTIGFAIIRVGDAVTIDEVVFGEPGDLELLGARSLEGLNLRVDSRAKKLVADEPILAAGSESCGGSGQMSQQININEIIEEIRRVNSEEKASCLSFRLFFDKQKLALSKKAILRPFDGKWTLACKTAGVTPCEAGDTKYLKPVKEYSKKQIREKLERMAHENPEGIIGMGLKNMV